jgi:hypothetical protein
MNPNIGLSEEQCDGVVKILNALLSDEYLLYTKTRNYHWNVLGRNSTTCTSSLRSNIPSLLKSWMMLRNGPGLSAGKSFLRRRIGLSIWFCKCSAMY